LCTNVSRRNCAYDPACPEKRASRPAPQAVAKETVAAAQFAQAPIF
jgi:hypothetical protein